MLGSKQSASFISTDSCHDISVDLDLDAALHHGNLARRSAILRCTTAIIYSLVCRRLHAHVPGCALSHICTGRFGQNLCFNLSLCKSGVTRTLRDDCAHPM